MTVTVAPNWAGWMLLGISTLACVLGCGLHGTPRTGKYNAGLEIAQWMLLMCLLYAAGAFG